MPVRESSHRNAEKFSGRRVAIACAFFALLSGLAACKSDRGGGSNSGAPSGELMVFAAASLTDAFEAVKKDFEEKYPEVEVRLNFAGSQSLRTQIENGAQPQVFASADTKHMNALLEEKLVEEPVTFAKNELVVVVPTSNPAGISKLEDLPKAKLIVLAGEAVPAGAYAERMLANASTADGYGANFADRVKANVASRENHVRQTLQKVVLGEADAAIVYATDAASAGGKVKAIKIPAEYNVVAAYPIATVTGAPDSKLGGLFVEYIRSQAGKDRLSEFGFSPAD